MNLEIDRRTDVWPQCDHRRIKSFSMPDLKNRVALSGSCDHRVSFRDGWRDRLLNEAMNACRQKTASNFSVRFGGNREADSVHVADQITPIRAQRDLVLVGDFSA